MNRTLFAVAALSSASSPVLLDSAVKATVLLTLAAAAAMLLRRDSAATRHLVWLLAIVAVLAMPAMSAILPTWRVLPDWPSVQPSAAAASLPPVARTAHGPAPQTALSSWNGHCALPLVWVVGFCVLVLRLVAARWMLWNTERRAMVLSSSSQTAKASHVLLVTTFQGACSQLGVSRRVTLLIHPDKTIPAIWGVLRPRLLLPATARHWSGEQLQSVLLHELAHIKRSDLMGQLLSQAACALYWFNPLVWCAAWRLGVERERACDDLVLDGGVRPSAYAEHLLDVATRFSPVRWTKACGLVMGRKSSLEGRLVAVLSGNVSRRKVSLALAAIALAVAVAIAVPIAMLAWATTEEQQTEIQRLGGTWTVVTQQMDGGPQSEPQPNDRMVFERNSLRRRQTAPDGTECGEEVSYTVDPTKSPKQINVSQWGKTAYGIYELDGDHLKICIDRSGQGRPSEFKSQPNSEQMSYTLQRMN